MEETLKEMLIKESRDIKKIVNKLIMLEQEHGQSDEYIALFDLYISVIKNERKMYSELNLDKYTLARILDLLHSDYSISEFYINLANVIDVGYNCVPKRVYQNIVSLLNDLHFNLKGNLELEENIDGIDEEERIEIQKEYQEGLIQVYIEKDIANLFYYLIEKSINNDDFLYIKNDLIYIKHNILFVCKDVESNFIYNNNDVVYLESKFFANLFEIDDETYEQYKNKYLLRLFEEQINYFLRLDVDDVFNKDVILELVIVQMLLEVSIALVDSSLINQVISYLNQSVNNSQLYFMDIVNKSISKKEEVKSKCRFISLLR